MFANRLDKVFRHLSKTARRQGISCYRIYDHDLPEFPFLIERYENSLSVSEYKRRHALSEEAHEAWLDECVRIMSRVTGVEESAIFIRMRQRKEGREGQYRKNAEEKNEIIAHENGLRFLVNLSDYLDTGLFLDHRTTRQMVRDEANEKRVLNLFCYTGSFSVYAVAGGAREVVSVDLSKTYLAWAERNLQLNFPDYTAHRAVHADVKQYLGEGPTESFDLIVLDPPTFSNSKRMDDILDIQRDHASLINGCLNLLTPGGLLYFSTNFTRFQMHTEAIRSSQIRDITRQTTPFDFTGKLKRPCYLIRKEGPPA